MKIKYRILKYSDSYTVEVMNPDTCIYQVLNRWYATLEEAQKGLQEYLDSLKYPLIVEKGYAEV